ncbi:hypothetical protein QR680_002100 [Steinernema hermaphroditum]|uniref:F-box domain-containing protein n=1 Tax=Steinernema hermaphroditum TaxID=289476 RepID=A0AA39H2Y8_9BILA|nr:hypothetical protein QR680_002100 [Steinernema hermaphroditum]
MSNSLTSLSTELQLRILQYLSPKELRRCSSTCRGLHAAISSNTLYLQRIPCTLRIVVCQECRVELQANGICNTFVCSFDELDGQIFSRVSVEHFQLVGNGNTVPADLFSVVLNYFHRFRHRNIISLSITDSFVSTESVTSLFSFFTFALQTANRIKVTNSSIPIDIPSIAIDNSEDLIKFEWTNSSIHGMEPSGPLASSTAVVQHFTKIVRQMGDQRRTLQLNTTVADPSAVADFIKAWSETREPPFFTVALKQIGADWQERFLHECALRCLTHVFYEFPSKRQPTSHIKVKFHPELNECDLWPVFDVPARTFGQQICYAPMSLTTEVNKKPEEGDGRPPVWTIEAETHLLAMIMQYRPSGKEGNQNMDRLVVEMSRIIEDDEFTSYECVLSEKDYEEFKKRMMQGAARGPVKTYEPVWAIRPTREEVFAKLDEFFNMENILAREPLDVSASPEEEEPKEMDSPPPKRKRGRKKKSV